jgi:D-glycero-D-manno-heptose 1,7-bisphosphate phosphatase
MQIIRAVFWDRDGVLNEVLENRNDGFQNVSPLKYSDFRLVGNIAKVLEKVSKLGYLNIVLTNQPDIARRKMAWDELNKMHEFLQKSIPEIKSIYICPHDNKDNCACRKPKPGLFFIAKEELEIDLSNSFMVGDSQNDIDAAKNAGVKSILLKTKYNSEVKSYDFLLNKVSEIFSLI